MPAYAKVENSLTMGPERMRERVVKSWTNAVVAWWMAAVGALAYTTPNTGVNWSKEDLVAHAGGKLTGAYPNYTLHQSIWLNTNDTLTIAVGSVITSVDGTPWPVLVIRGTLIAAGTGNETIVIAGGMTAHEKTE